MLLSGFGSNNKDTPANVVSIVVGLRVFTLSPSLSLHLGVVGWGCGDWLVSALCV